MVVLCCVQKRKRVTCMCTAHDLGLRLHLNSRFCANWLFVRDLRFRGEVWALSNFFATLTGVAEQKKGKERARTMTSKLLYVLFLYCKGHRIADTGEQLSRRSRAAPPLGYKLWESYSFEKKNWPRYSVHVGHHPKVVLLYPGNDCTRTSHPFCSIPAFLLLPTLPFSTKILTLEQRRRGIRSKNTKESQTDILQVGGGFSYYTPAFSSGWSASSQFQTRRQIISCPCLVNW